MAGKPGRSGPPNNLNATKHGLSVWLSRRMLPPGKQHIAQLIRDYRAGKVACKGGEGAVTEIEEGLIDNATLARGACLLILEEAASKGFIRQVGDTWDLSPGFARLAQFLAAERMALVALGLSRRAKDVDLARAFQEVERQRSEEHNEG